jgi:hypothetical protein
MAQIATFASSVDGRLYGRVCERYGVDPAAGFTSDPIEAANLRAALAVASIPEPETTDAPADHSPAFGAAQAATAEAFPRG